MTSIRLFLIISIISVVILANFLAALHGYQESMQEAEVLFDKKLQNYAEFLSTNSFPENAPITLSRDKKHYLEEVLYQVRDEEAQLIAQSESFPVDIVFPSQAEKRYINFDRARWRSIQQYFAVSKRWVVVLEEQDVRYNLAESVILKSVYPIIIAIPTIALLVLFIVYLGLKPLQNLANQVDLKQASNLSAIELDDLPHELSRLTQRVNELLARLNGSLSREIRFASDAAHELRTPIAALNLQMKNLEDDLEDGAIDKNENIMALGQGVKRMSHLVEQILTLNRSSPELYAEKYSPINIADVLKACVVELYPLVERSQHEIEYISEDSQPIILVMGEEFALSTLFKNLIINAIKYTPNHGNIMIRLSQNSTQVKVSIMDSGPGIKASDRSRIFERFYRADGDRNDSQIDGCGLGLAIVKQIADLHHVKLELSDSLFQTPSGEQIKHGLAVKLTFERINGLDC